MDLILGVPHISPVLRDVGIGTSPRLAFPRSRNNSETWGIPFLPSVASSMVHPALKIFLRLADD